MGLERLRVMHAYGVRDCTGEEGFCAVWWHMLSEVDSQERSSQVWDERAIYMRETVVNVMGVWLHSGKLSKK